jgi:cytochrome c553
MRLRGLLLVVAAPVLGAGAPKQSSPEPIPEWAFAIDAPGSTAAEASPEQDARTLQVPGSAIALTRPQTRDYFNPPDWHPDGHPVMPAIVAHGRAPEVIACGYCHLPNGQGRPENASIAGLPAAYIIQQVADFKAGIRRSSEPRHAPTATMIARETQATDAELDEAARYFSNLEPKPWIRVVETDSVPVTHVAGWMHVTSQPEQLEPIGSRVIEMAQDLERTELRDDASGFVAFVPRGSLAAGKVLVETGGAGGRTVQCPLCHGPDLKGVGVAPSIAGRSPSYIVRQLFDLQRGSRAGAGAALMAPVVSRLSNADRVAIAAYLASLPP